MTILLNGKNFALKIYFFCHICEGWWPWFKYSKGCNYCLDKILYENNFITITDINRKLIKLESNHLMYNLVDDKVSTNQSVYNKKLKEIDRLKQLLLEKDNEITYYNIMITNLHDKMNILIYKQILHYDRIIRKQLDDFYKIYPRLLSIDI